MAHGVRRRNGRRGRRGRRRRGGRRSQPRPGHHRRRTRRQRHRRRGRQRRRRPRRIPRTHPAPSPGTARHRHRVTLLDVRLPSPHDGRRWRLRPRGPKPCRRHERLLHRRHDGRSHGRDSHLWRRGRRRRGGEGLPHCAPGGWGSRPGRRGWGSLRLRGWRHLRHRRRLPHHRRGGRWQVGDGRRGRRDRRRGGVSFRIRHHGRRRRPCAGATRADAPRWLDCDHQAHEVARGLRVLCQKRDLHTNRREREGRVAGREAGRPPTPTMETSPVSRTPGATQACRRSHAS